jgi:hypothetical protein
VNQLGILFSSRSAASAELFCRSVKTKIKRDDSLGAVAGLVIKNEQGQEMSSPCCRVS